MISVIGIGNAASAIAKKFEKISNYDVYVINSKVKTNTPSQYKVKEFDAPEEYESHIPDLRDFFKNVRPRVQVFVMGSSMSSSYTLGILEQIKDRHIELFYIKPDIELLTGVPKLLENAAFGVLQEYARSGLFKAITLLSNLELEKALGEVPIKTYYETLNESIFSAVHYLNYFEYSEPEIGQVSKPAAANRIKTIGILNVKKLEEKWLFDLDTPRELCYYICINEKKLATEGGLHKKIVEQLKDKPKNAFRKLSYAIYETEHEDFGFCVAHTNVVQQQKTFDSSS
jgi:hypothetical protein